MQTVVIQGLGFVGLAMATVVANAVNKAGKPLYNVIGIDLPMNQARIDQINLGELPFRNEDDTFPIQLKRAVLEYKNLITSTDENWYKKADIVVVDIQLDIKKKTLGNAKDCCLEKDGFIKAIHTLGKHIKPECLVLVETTVPPGFCRRVVKPALDREFLERGIDIVAYPPRIAHSYERVMPGKEYLSSIRSYPRTFSGLDKQSAIIAREFLENVIEIDKFPLREEKSTETSELAKVMENSYRAVNIALVNEWTLLAEKMEVNIFDVIDGIKIRKTHNNMLYPGLGVGGYCLTKDTLLAYWSGKHFYDENLDLPMTIKGININDTMPWHTYDLIKAVFLEKEFKTIMLGVSYREDVGDTRYAPAEQLYIKLVNDGLDVDVHDPYVEIWSEQPKARFIKNITNLKEYDCVVLGVKHHCYLNLTAEELIKATKPETLIVDANNILDDEKILTLLKSGRDVVGVGKGHIKRMKREI
ncbi:MAG: nucleotide sugar dehydrogenase [Candidatus Cloacimonadales bacterium]